MRWERLPAAIAGACLAALTLGACDGRIYVRDGVTDGDTFYLPEYVIYDDDPALQSWVAYSLDLSTCQLTLGGDNPARNSSFDCEHGAHEILVQSWQGQLQNNAGASDGHLDTLLEIANYGYLREYVAVELARPGWELPDDLDRDGYRTLLGELRADVKPQRRIVGSWNYADEQQRLSPPEDRGPQPLPQP